MKQPIVINTGPIISIIAATGDLDILSHLFTEIYVTREVAEEITVQNSIRFGADEFSKCSFLIKEKTLLQINPMLTNTLDPGEASVVQLALDRSIKKVSIDEVVGRRVARLNGLELIGSLGILIKAKQNQLISSVGESIKRMLESGIYISQELIETALRLSGEEK
jgi:predicted nucleic acid-binding protein